MTRLLVFSDLHLEMRPHWTMPEHFPDFDVAVVAGDVDRSPIHAIHLLATSPALRGRPAVFVPGNHEFFHAASVDEALEDGAAFAEGTPVHFLDRRAVTIEGVRFVGATLWTDYALDGDVQRSEDACAVGISDHVAIRTRHPMGIVPFRPFHAMARHAADLAFIRRELEAPFSGPRVVVTHHAPHPGSVHVRYAGDPCNAAFASDLTSVIEAGRADLWVHGHVHDSVDYVVGPTRIVCNPKGYGPRIAGRQPENPRFDPCFVVEV